VRGPLEGRLGTVIEVRIEFGERRLQLSLDVLGNGFWLYEDRLERSKVRRAS
jgi:hypothetical protein